MWEDWQEILSQLRQLEQGEATEALYQSVESRISEYEKMHIPDDAFREKLYMLSDDIKAFSSMHQESPNIRIGIQTEGTGNAVNYIDLRRQRLADISTGFDDLFNTEPNVQKSVPELKKLSVPEHASGSDGKNRTKEIMAMGFLKNALDRAVKAAKMIPESMKDVPESMKDVLENVKDKVSVIDEKKDVIENGLSMRWKSEHLEEYRKQKEANGTYQSTAWIEETKAIKNWADNHTQSMFITDEEWEKDPFSVKNYMLKFCEPKMYDDYCAKKDLLTGFNKFKDSAKEKFNDFSDIVKKQLEKADDSEKQSNRYITLPGNNRVKMPEFKVTENIMNKVVKNNEASKYDQAVAALGNIGEGIGEVSLEGLDR